MTAVAKKQGTAPPLLVSIHDVMPETLGAVGRILGVLEEAGHRGVTLLVVPGRDWTPAGLDVLRRWQDAGHPLAGHGWRHEAATIRGLGHRLHSLLISRRVAEHLALEARDIAALMRRCHAWFAEHDLAPPSLYVPPAWALGRLPRAALVGLPFARVEVFFGEIDGRTGRLHPQALLGFEADAPERAPVLRAFNAANRALARRFGLPLRLGIHPQDLDLALGADLRRLIAETGKGARDSQGNRA